MKDNPLMERPDIHRAAAIGFQASVDAYQRGRPDYLREAVEFLAEKLGLGPGKTVCELGAGTGKFTKTLADVSRATIVAVDPVEAMRTKFAELLPQIRVLDGTAENIPLESRSVDAVVVAQAFHWFRGEVALEEIHRVLKPGGRLGLLWNARDERVAWVEKLTRIIDPIEGGVPQYRHFGWRKAFESTTLFGPLEKGEFWYRHPSTPDSVCDRIASISFIAALSEERRRAVLEQVREMLRQDAETRGKENFDFPYRTDVYWCHT